MPDGSTEGIHPFLFALLYTEATKNVTTKTKKDRGRRNLLNHPERQVNALSNGALGFGDLVLPMVLGRPGHEQKTTVFQYQVLFGLRGIVAKVKRAFGPKTHRTNHRINTQLRFIVGVPRHAVRTAPVIVEQNTVVNGTR
jgi:hypothetical protein